MDRNLFLAFGLSFAVLLVWTVFVDPPPPPTRAPTELEAPAPGTPREAAALPELSPAIADTATTLPSAPAETVSPAIAAR